MTPHTAGVACWTARIRRNGVPCSTKPTSRNVKLSVLIVIAPSGSSACRKYRIRYENPSAATSQVSTRECSSLAPGRDGMASACRRRRQPHHDGHHDQLDEHRHDALPQEDRVTKRDEAARHQTASGHD